MSIKTLNVGIGKAMGLNQGIDENLMSLKYSPDCQNIDVSQGILSTRKGMLNNATTLETGYAIKRIFRFENEAGEDIVIAGAHSATAGDKWFFKLGGDTGWYDIETVGGVDLTSVDTHYCAALTAQISGDEFMILTGWSGTVKLWYDSDDFKVYYAALGGTPPNGAFITAHRDRLWMASVLGEYNTLYYSNAYDAEDWTTAGQTGEITIETFDGDAIMSVQNVFDDVLVFKRNTVWKINGDIPSEYSVDQVYATEGCLYTRGVCSDGNLCFYASTDGIFRYDGVSAAPILTDEIKNIYHGMDDVVLKMINHILYVFDGKYLGEGIGKTYVGKCIIYDVIKKTISVMKSMTIVDATASERQGKGTVYVTDGTDIYEFQNTVAWVALKDGTTIISAYWYTPETDFGYPNAEKTLDEIAFVGWGTDSAGAAGGQVKFTIYYNRGSGQQTYEKIVTLAATRTPYAIPLTLTGRIMKIKVENVNGSAINISDLRFIFELDED